VLRSSLSTADLRDLLLRLLPMSASLAGFCVAGIALLNTHAKDFSLSSLGDDFLACATPLFLLCAYLTFWALRTSKEARFRTLARAVDILFLVGLTLVVVSGMVHRLRDFLICRPHSEREKQHVMEV
jgi:nitrate reductase gamma subunit